MLCDFITVSYRIYLLSTFIDCCLLIYRRVYFHACDRFCIYGRIRDVTTRGPPGLLSEQWQRTARLRPDGGTLDSPDVSQARSGGSVQSSRGVQPRQSYQTLHRIHQWKVSLYRQGIVFFKIKAKI